MSLERAYRRLLRAYPARWRAEREQEVLSVLLDAAEAEGRQRPAAGEVADLVGHGLLARLGGRLDSRARETTALLALASLTTVLLLCLFVGEWWPWPVAERAPEDRPVSAWPGTPGPFNTVAGPVVAAMLAGPVLAVLGRARAARLVLLVSVPVVLSLPVLAALLDLRRPAAWALAALVGFAVLSLAAPVRRPVALSGLTAALTAVLVVALWSNHTGGDDPRPYFYVGYDLAMVARFGPWAVALGLAFAAGRRVLLRPAALVGACWLSVFAVQVWPTDHLYVAPALTVATLLVAGALGWPSRRLGYRDAVRA